MMRTLIVVLGLLVAGVAGAEGRRSDAELLLMLGQLDQPTEDRSFTKQSNRNRHRAEPWPCLQKMEQAMRAREEWAALTDERDRWTTVTTAWLAGTSIVKENIIHSFPEEIDSPMNYTFKTDTRTEEERLADEQKALDDRRLALSKRREEERVEREKRQERQGRIIVLKTQWELGKVCWSKSAGTP